MPSKIIPKKTWKGIKKRRKWPKLYRVTISTKKGYDRIEMVIANNKKDVRRAFDLPKGQRIKSIVRG